jgi:hypothetical protein
MRTRGESAAVKRITQQRGIEWASGVRGQMPDGYALGIQKPRLAAGAG